MNSNDDLQFLILLVEDFQKEHPAELLQALGVATRGEPEGASGSVFFKGERMGRAWPVDLLGNDRKPSASTATASPSIDGGER